MSKQFDYDTVVLDYKSAVKMPTSPKRRLVSEDHIFDEDMTVKWNKKQVELNNKRFREERRELQETRSKYLNEAREQVIAYLQQETGFDNTILHKLFDYIRTELLDEDDGIETFIEIVEDICDIFRENQ